MGFDKQIFDAFKIGYKYGIFGTSYDTLHGFWDISGLADYVIARAHVDPTKDYDYYVSEYCSSYGLAAKEAKEYFDYIRKNIWDKQLWPKRKEISNAGRYGNFRQGLMWNIHTYYSEKDFDNLDELVTGGADISFYRKKAQLKVEQLKKMRADLNALTAAIKATDEEYQKAKKQVLSVEKKAPEIIKKYKEVKAVKDAEKKPFEEQLSILEKEISAELLEIYKTKRKEKIFPVVGQINGNRCPYCSMDLPIAARSKLSGGEWIECENHICNRILFE